MSREQEELRQEAANLRMKAATGQLAVAAARDIAVRLPRELAAEIEKQIASGEFAKRWAKEWGAARAVAPTLDNPDAADEEATLAAVAALLAWHAKLAQNVAARYAEETENQRQRAIGKAEGIEATLPQKS